MKKILKNKYFLYIIIAAIGAYILYYLSKGKNSNSSNYTSNFDNITNIMNNDLVDEDFCNTTEMQAFGNEYVLGCLAAVGNCSKLDLVGEMELYGNSQISGDPYECSLCCAN